MKNNNDYELDYDELLKENEKLKDEKRYLEDKIRVTEASNIYQFGVLCKKIFTNPIYFLFSPFLIFIFFLKVLKSNFDERITPIINKYLNKHYPPTKLAFVCNTGLVGGAEKIALAHLKFASTKYQCDAYFQMEGGPVAQEAKQYAKKVKIRYNLENSLSRYKYIYLVQTFPDISYIKKINPNCIISFILHDHLSAWITLFAKHPDLDKIDRIFCISNLIRETVLRKIPNIDPNKVKVLYNTYFWGNNNPNSVEQKEVNLEYYHFGYNGRVSPEKNTLGLVKIFRKFIQVHPNIKLTITGPCNSEDYKKVFLKELEGVAQIKYEGPLPDSSVLFKQIDGLAFASFIEGVSVSATEALSFGVPVITTNVGGMGEIIKDGKNGVVVNTDPIKFNPFHQGSDYRSLTEEDEKRYLEGLERFIKTKWDRKEISADTISKFSEEVIKTKFLGYLDELLN